MSYNQINGQPMSARSEILSGEKKRNRPVRSASLHSARPSMTICCAECKLPLLIESHTRDFLNQSRAESKLQNEHLCRECTEEKMKNQRKSSSRLVRSSSMNWSNMNNNIETWFEKAPTPDQRIVYKFLHQINNNNTQNGNITEKPTGKSLDNVLKNLKKYEPRFDVTRPKTSKFTRVFESSSWRVLRQPIKPYYQTNAYNQNTAGEYNGSIFAPTYRKMGSTFLIHPSWI